MAGRLRRSPANVLQQLLIKDGLGNAPNNADPGSVTWPVYVGDEPDKPDKVITVFNTTGRVAVRDHTGERDSHPGVQFRIRAALEHQAWEKAHEIATHVDEEVENDQVTIGAQRYLVYAVTRTGEVIQLRTEKVLKAERKVFVFNAVVALKQLA